MRPAGSTSRLRWLGAEFLVVAAGVVAGLAVDQWRAVRAQQVLEADYLEQIASEMEENGRRIVILENWNAVTAEQGKILSVWLAGTPPVPPRDSVATALAYLSLTLNISFLDAAFEGLVASSDNLLLSPTRELLRIAYDEMRRWEAFYLLPPTDFLSRMRQVVPPSLVNGMVGNGDGCVLVGTPCRFSDADMLHLRDAVDEISDPAQLSRALNEYLSWLSRFTRAIDLMPATIEAGMSALAER